MILVDPTLDKSELDCLHSFGYPQMNYRQMDIQDAYPGTCSWIFQHRAYACWINNQYSTLWIKGKAGSGKSTLVKFLCCNCQDDLVLDFFFHERGSNLEKSSIGMFQAFLHQLFSQENSVRSLIKASYQDGVARFGAYGNNWQWRLRQLEDLFREAVMHAAESRVVTIFVDALDEAGAEVAGRLRSYFLALSDDLAFKKGVLRICISCRHYPVLALQETLEIRLEDESYYDISVFVKDKISSKLLEEYGLSTQDCEMLENEIIQRSSGMFIWVSLVITMIIKSVSRGSSRGEILERLLDTPDNLASLYQHIFDSIDMSHYLSRSLHLMQWIFLAERPLSVTELRCALAYDDTAFYKDGISYLGNDAGMRRMITTLSAGLIEVRHNKESTSYDSTSVQFIHGTVREFLIVEGLKRLALAAHHSDVEIMGQGQDRLCRACVRYLKREEMLWTESMRERDKLWLLLPFIDYASTYWSEHAKRAEDLGFSQGDLVQQLGSSPNVTFNTWLHKHRKIDCHHSDAICPDPEFPFHLPSSNSESGKSGQATATGNSNRALHYAAHWGHTYLINMLLDAGASLKAKDGGGRTVLEKASANGHRKVVRLLLDRGSEPNEPTGTTGNALQSAALKGHVEVVETLLESGAEVNACGGKYHTALQAAAYGGKYGGSEAVVQQLLDQGAGVNLRGGHFGTALQAAAYGGNETVVSLLLKYNAGVNIRAGEYGTALQAAALTGNERLAGLLLDSGAEVNNQGGRYCTALQAAASTGKEAVTRLLIERGANVHTRGGWFDSALQAAGYGGNEAVVRLLLDEGADIKVQGGRYGTALQAAAFKSAAYGGSEDVVRVLLDRGAEVNAKCGQYNTALQAAAYGPYGSNQVVVGLLLDKAAEEEAAQKKAAEEKAAEEKAAKEKAAEEKAVEEKAVEEKAVEEKATKDEAAKDVAAKDVATKDVATKDMAAKCRPILTAWPPLYGLRDNKPWTAPRY